MKPTCAPNESDRVYLFYILRLSVRYANIISCSGWNASNKKAVCMIKQKNKKRRNIRTLELPTGNIGMMLNIHVY